MTDGSSRTSGGWQAKVLGPAVGVVVFLGVIAWLTWRQGAPRWDVLIYLAALAIVFGAVRGAPALSEALRENLTFLVTAFGLIGLLGTLSGWQASYLVFITITALIFALFSLGLNLEYGHTGIINFGHVAFMGIGAYMTTLISRAWLPSAATLVGSRGPSLVLLAITALFAFVVVAVLGNVAFEAWTARGSSGASGDRRAPLVAGIVAGLGAALLVVLVVPFPLTGTAASAYLIAGTVLAGMVTAAIAGVLLGLPTLRLREDYLAIVTIGFAEILRRFWTNEQWLTEGTQGVTGFPLPFRDAVAEWSWLTTLSDTIGAGSPYKVLLLLLVLGVLAFVYVTYEILLRSPYGRVLKAIREDEDVASALGKNVFAYKLQALALGSAVAALAGAFLAWHRVFISPNTFLPLFTFYAWIIIVVGGLGNNKGTIIGALFLYTIFESTRFLNLEQALGVTSSQAAAFRVFLIGILFIVLMMFKPEGILGKREEMVLGD